MLKLQFTLISGSELFISTQSLATIFQQASYICLLCVSSCLFCSLREFTCKNLPLVSFFVESKFCWQSGEIRLSYHLGSYMLNDWLQFQKSNRNGRRPSWAIATCSSENSTFTNDYYSCSSLEFSWFQDFDVSNLMPLQCSFNIGIQIGDGRGMPL